MSKVSNLQVAAIAGIALAFLIAMAVTGALPRQRQLVKFEAKGVMQVPPEAISRIQLRRGERSVTLERAAGAEDWARTDGQPVPRDTAAHLSTAVQMMNTSAPVKVITEQDLQGSDRPEFGLESPAVTAALYRGSAPILEFRLGSLNPEGYLQYMALRGSKSVYLMSRFVGAEWSQAADVLLQ